MARKTFISYKYSEGQELRDAIIEKLGDDATFYKGETSESPDISDTSTDNIKESLKNMMFDTSVTIVIVSPEMIKSNWIDWEIEYTLKEIKRKETRSRTNGLVGVIMKVNGSYDWLISTSTQNDGCSSRYIDKSKLYGIINGNRFNNTTDNRYSCKTCGLYDAMEGSYMSLVTEGNFLSDPAEYIEGAFDKSQRTNDFNLQKQK